MTFPYESVGFRRRILLEAVALAFTFRFHEENSFVRKWTTVIFFLTWSVMTIMMVSGIGVEMWMYMPMTAIVFYIVGREHEAELHRFLVR